MTFTLGGIDLNDRTKYRFTQQPTPFNFDQAKHPRRGTTGQMLTYRKLRSVTFAYELECIGADLDEAWTNYQAIVTMLDQAADFHELNIGSEKLLIEQIGNAPERRLSIQSGTWTEVDQALWSINIVTIQLNVDCVPSVAGIVEPWPLRVQLVLPLTTVFVPVGVSPSPLTVALSLPASTISLETEVNPTPLVVVLSLPDPVDVGPSHRFVSPDPLVVTLELPAPTVVGPEHLFVSPDPLVVTFALPDPVITASSPGPEDFVASYDYWFRSYDLAGANNSILTTWSGLDPNTRDATKSGANGPKIIDGQGPNSDKRVVQFDRTVSDAMTFPTIDLNSAQIFIVAKITSTVDQGTIIRTSVTAGHDNYGFGVGESFGDRWLYFHAYNAAGATVQKRRETALIGALPTLWKVYRIELDNTTGVLAAYRNQSLLTVSADSVGLSGVSGLNPSSKVSMQVAQIIVAHGLSEADLDTLEQMLMTEIGL